MQRHDAPRVIDLDALGDAELVQLARQRDSGVKNHCEESNSILWFTITISILTTSLRRTLRAHHHGAGAAGLPVPTRFQFERYGPLLLWFNGLKGRFLRVA